MSTTNMQTTNINHIYTADETTSPVLILSESRGMVVIPVEQIIRIQSISNYSKLFMNNEPGCRKTLVVAKILYWFEQHPALVSFVRIHRSHLINRQYIKTYSGSKCSLLLLKNAEAFTIARRRKSVLNKQLNGFNRFPEKEQPLTSPVNQI